MNYLVTVIWWNKNDGLEVVYPDLTWFHDKEKALKFAEDMWHTECVRSGIQSYLVLVDSFIDTTPQNILTHKRRSKVAFSPWHERL